MLHQADRFQVFVAYSVLVSNVSNRNFCFSLAVMQFAFLSREQCSSVAQLSSVNSSPNIDCVCTDTSSCSYCFQSRGPSGWLPKGPLPTPEGCTCENRSRSAPQLKQTWLSDDRVFEADASHTVRVLTLTLSTPCYQPSDMITAPASWSSAWLSPLLWFLEILSYSRSNLTRCSTQTETWPWCGIC